jgi:hypothetical protein
MLSLTIIFSQFFIEWNITGWSVKPKYKLIGVNVSENTNVGCPCKNIGIEPSGCKILFIKGSENPNLFFEMQPGVEQIVDGYGICIPSFYVKINSYGFRDYEYSQNKSNDTFRIVVLGDSITFGHGIELNETYSKVLERLLNKRNDGWRYEVLNFGVPGYNAIEKVEVLNSKAIKFHPDLIIFQYLGDDIINRTEFFQIEKEKIQEYVQKTGRNASEFTEMEKREVHENAYSDYLKILEEKRFDETWKIVEKSFEKLFSITQNKTFLLSFDDQLQLSRLDNISQTYDWPIIYVNDFLKNYPQEKLIIHPKDNHPNAFAHMLIAEEIYKKLVSGNLIPYKEGQK